MLNFRKVEMSHDPFTVSVQPAVCCNFGLKITLQPVNNKAHAEKSHTKCTHYMTN